MTKTLKSIFVLLIAVVAMCSVSAYAAEENTALDAAFANAIASYDTTVDVTEFNMTADEVMTAFLAYLDETPRNFFVSKTVNCSYSTATNKAKELTISYNDSPEAINAKLAAFDAEVANITALVDGSMAAEEKAKTIHDYFIESCSYDLTCTARTAYDAIVNKTGVCEAYSSAYQYVMNMIGVPCTTVSSDAMNHSWNVVEVNGVAYHVDVTWDDPLVDGANTNTTPYYDNFMKSDAEISVDHYAWS